MTRKWATPKPVVAHVIASVRYPRKDDPDEWIACACGWRVESSTDGSWDEHVSEQRAENRREIALRRAARERGGLHARSDDPEATESDDDSEAASIVA